jgi:hypothetical protein
VLVLQLTDGLQLHSSMHSYAAHNKYYIGSQHLIAQHIEGSVLAKSVTRLLLGVLVLMLTGMWRAGRASSLLLLIISSIDHSSAQRSLVQSPSPSSKQA